MIARTKIWLRMCIFIFLTFILQSFLDIGHPAIAEYFYFKNYYFICIYIFLMIKYMQILRGYIE